MSQSGIGQFVIGESAIGIGPSAFDYRKTVISQYANSPTLVQLIENASAYIDPAANIDAFFDMMWNIDTAQGYGLDVWGRILGVERTLQVPTAGVRYFGFKQAVGLYITGFGLGRFYGGSKNINSNYTMTDDQYRQVLLAKAAANISDGSARGINQILLALFPGRGNAYIQDNGDMTMTYVFDFALTPVEVATIAQSGVLPRPTGVLTSFTSM